MQILGVLLLIVSSLILSLLHLNKQSHLIIKDIHFSWYILVLFPHFQIDTTLIRARH